MIILASASPRRQELLKLICDDFTVEPANIDEALPKGVPLEEIPQSLALQKALHIQSRGHFGDIVIGCDTGVFADGAMLGKPRSPEDACEMLRELSGKTHKVITGCALLYKDKTEVFSQTTKVSFYELSEEEIKAYVISGEPMDKAGAYGIQGKGGLFVEQIVGDYFNVVGLPVALLNRKLSAVMKSR